VKAGRPGIRLELVAEARSFIGVEIGVEHITAVEIDLAANVVRSKLEAFDGPSAGVENAVAHALRVARTVAPGASLALCEGFGVSAPAQMDSFGFVRTAPLLGWRDVHLADLVRRSLPSRIPVLVENDANAFAFGASYRHSALGAGVTLYLVMESGLGGGLVIDGKLFRGGHGLAGEIGHLLLSKDEGSRNLEQVLGLGAVMNRYSALTRMPTLAGLLADVESGRAEAITIAEDWAGALAYGLIQACRIIDADRIVLGGSLAALYLLVAPRVVEMLRAMQEADFPDPAIIVDLDACAGPAFGAACLLHQRYLSLESQRLMDAPGTGET
jgi:predicted NBD/HSP70 family sugar kinase